MMWLVLLAQGERRDPFRTPEIVWGTAGIAVALLAGALAVWLVERWRKRSVPKPDAAGELTDYRGMFERGEITEDEYVRLRDRVARRAKAAAPPAGPRDVLLDLLDAAEPDPPAPPKGPDDAPPGPGNPANRPPPA